MLVPATRKRKASVALQPPSKRRKTGGAVQFQRNIALKSEEKKNIDVDQLNGIGPPIVHAQTTAVRKLLNPCAQGTTALTRAGRRYTMVSLEYRFAASLAATTAGSSPIRLLIVYDKQPNGALAATTDVVQVDELESPMNLNNSRRFKVLVDEIISEGLSTNGPSAFYIKGHRDFTAKGTRTGLEVECKDTSAGDITDITTGAIISFCWNNGNLITADPTCALYTRIRFTDP